MLEFSESLKLFSLWKEEEEEEEERRRVYTKDSEAVSERKTLKKRGNLTVFSAIEDVGSQREREREWVSLARERERKR